MKTVCLKRGDLHVQKVTDKGVIYNGIFLNFCTELLFKCFSGVTFKSHIVLINNRGKQAIYSISMKYFLRIIIPPPAN